MAGHEDIRRPLPRPDRKQVEQVLSRPASVRRFGSADVHHAEQQQPRWRRGCRGCRSGEEGGAVDACRERLRCCLVRPPQSAVHSNPGLPRKMHPKNIVPTAWCRVLFVCPPAAGSRHGKRHESEDMSRNERQKDGSSYAPARNSITAPASFYSRLLRLVGQEDDRSPRRRGQNGHNSAPGP